jgi:hypothetical protein
MEPPLPSQQGSSARRAILILGMHRSGTSAITRTLGLRGAALPLHTIPAGFDNEAGFWEPLEIVNLHDEILRSAGSSWDDPAAFSEAWFGSGIAEKFKTRLAGLLVRDFPDEPPLFAVKDPRLCYLVPLWLSMLQELGIEPLFVIPVRNPLEIAASLRKRNSIQEEHSLLLWLRHFLAAERTTRNRRRSFICYDNLLRDWRGTVDKIGQDLGIDWPRQSPTSDVEITQFIATALRHHHYTDTEVYTRKNVAEWVKTAFSWALRATDHPPADFAVLDAIGADLQAADVAFMPLIADGRLSIVRLNQEVEQTTAFLGQKDDELRRLDVRTADELQQLRGQLQSNHVALRQLRTETAAAKQLRDDLQSAQAEAQHKVDETDAARSDAEARISDLRAVYDQSRSELTALRYQHERVVTSTTWRALAPIRSVAAFVPYPVRKQVRRGMKLIYSIAAPRRSVALPRAGQDGAIILIPPATPREAVDPDAGLAAITVNPAARTLGPGSEALPGSAAWPLLVPLGHFYSPVVDPGEIRKREAQLWSATDVVEGVELNLEGQLALLAALKPHTSSIDYPVDDPGDNQTYFYSNEQYPVLDAEFLHAALLYFRPKTMIEVGSGFSSLVTAGVNRGLLEHALDFTCIEPYPRQFLLDGIDGITRVIEKKVEDVDPSFFDRLGSGDILFIDSSHVSKAGSDVNYLLFEIFPRLKPGVMIHIHDIFLPDEYPKEWVLDHGRNWNEQYLLRAFMQYNRSFKVMWAANFMGTRHLPAVQATFPRYPAFGGGGSFWICKTG